MYIKWKKGQNIWSLNTEAAQYANNSWDVISKLVQKLNYQGIFKADEKYNTKIFFAKDKQNIKKTEICIGNKGMGAELLYIYYESTNMAVYAVYFLRRGRGELNQWRCSSRGKWWICEQKIGFKNKGSVNFWDTVWGKGACKILYTQGIMNVKEAKWDIE